MKKYTEKDITPGFCYINKRVSNEQKRPFIAIVLKDIDDEYLLVYWPFFVFYSKIVSTSKAAIIQLLNNEDIEELLPLKP